MKRLLTLTLIASSLASSVRAFDLDISRDQALERMGLFTVSDLSVGVQGSISPNFVCRIDADLYVYNTVLKSDRKFEFYEIERQPNGEFTLSFVNNTWDEQPSDTVQWPSLVFSLCYQQTIELMDGIFPIASIDGYTSYSNWLDHMLATYEVDK